MADAAELVFYSVKPWLFSVKLFCMFPSTCLQQKHCKVWAVRAGNTKNAMNAFFSLLERELAGKLKPQDGFLLNVGSSDVSLVFGEHIFGILL